MISSADGCLMKKHSGFSENSVDTQGVIE